MGYGAFYVICPRACSQSVTPLALTRTPDTIQPTRRFLTLTDPRTAEKKGLVT